MVIDVALKNKLHLKEKPKHDFSIVKFVLSPKDLKSIKTAIDTYPDTLFYKSAFTDFNHSVTDSSTRMGFAIFCTSSPQIANELRGVLFNEK